MESWLNVHVVSCTKGGRLRELSLWPRFFSSSLIFSPYWLTVLPPGPGNSGGRGGVLLSVVKTGWSAATHPTIIILLTFSHEYIQTRTVSRIILIDTSGIYSGKSGNDRPGKAQNYTRISAKTTDCPATRFSFLL